VRILIAVGKSGGHIFPGLSLASRLKERLKGSKIFFVGEKDRLTKEIFSRQPYPLFTVSISSLPYGISAGYVRFLARLMLAVGSVWNILRRIKPDIVVGFGGAISGPLLLISCLRKIPTIIHEQNVVPGRSNRIIANFVDKIAISFRESEKFFNQNRVILTGNPVRRSILDHNRAVSMRELGLDDNKFTILVIGGSQGSSQLNKIARHTFSQMDKQAKANFQIIHITGKKDYQQIKECYQGVGFGSVVLPFCDKMGIVYSASDLVLARAGASTISEITSRGLGSILVPYPYAGKHQLANAKALSDRDGAVLIEEKNFSAEYLKKVFLDLMENRADLNKIAHNSKTIGRPQADQKLAEEVIKLVEDRNALI
jgi:UDP-N-acetylglucosamine--N-acetylmuramyl-(pentapeptide) pyrophosphoryl-undecaprenol N-acetylglucosamine transferase